MIAKLKKLLYFPIASYFRFFAGLRLKRWNPRILVVTGSSGKTTLLHMLDAQIGDNARYSYHANSSFGIPFDILGLKRTSLLKSEWISLILKTPFAAFKNPPKERLYIVEVDCDRPGEGKFLALFLKPEIVLWVSTSNTHAMNFDHLVKKGGFEAVEEAIAYEFGYFLEYCKERVILNGDSSLMNDQVKRTKAKIITIQKEKLLKSYEVRKDGTFFEIDSEKYRFRYFLPEEIFYSIKMCKEVCDYLSISFDQSFSDFQIPPGRGSIFEGIKDTILIDSSYNATPASMRAAISMYNKLQADKKWLVIGDMVELGEAESEEHEKLAKLLAEHKFDKIILMGKRVSKYTYPLLSQKSKVKSQKFQNPKEALDYILDNVKGGEVILFKGARFMEGIIEHLLMNKKDISHLPRREKVWDIRRKQWGL